MAGMAPLRLHRRLKAQALWANQARLLWTDFVWLKTATNRMRSAVFESHNEMRSAG